MSHPASERTDTPPVRPWEGIGVSQLFTDATPARRAYVTEQYAIIAGHPVSLNDRQVAAAWALLSREEERAAPRDGHGNVPPAETVLGHLKLLEHPPLHADLAHLTRLDAPPRWPRGHRFAACLTHDVDVVDGSPWRDRLRRLQTFPAAPRGQRLRWMLAGTLFAARHALRLADMAPFDLWMSEEARFGFRSTFFVMPETYLRPSPWDHFHRYSDPVSFQGRRMPYADAIRAARHAGWEIGLHGSYASALNATVLEADLAGLEAVLGERVVSARQHFLRFQVETTPGLLAAVGIQADSTLGYSTTIGCRAGIAFPYFWPDYDDLLEVPLVVQDVGLLRGAVSYDTQLQRARALVARIAEVGGVATLSWHTHPDTPGAREAYRALLETVAELGGWGCTLGELNTWWRARRDAVRATFPSTPQEA